MAEQLTLNGGAVKVGKPRKCIGILYTGAACTLSSDAFRELDALTEHGPAVYPKGAQALVLPFDPMPPGVEAQVRAWAARHRVRLWEGTEPVADVPLLGLEET